MNSTLKLKTLAFLSIIPYILLARSLTFKVSWVAQQVKLTIDIIQNKTKPYLAYRIINILLNTLKNKYIV
jgi:hypothetical protein